MWYRIKIAMETKIIEKVYSNLRIMHAYLYVWKKLYKIMTVAKHT